MGGALRPLRPVAGLHVRTRDGWITVPWIHHAMASAPFADFTLATRPAPGRWNGAWTTTSETDVARVLDELLTRAEAGPGDRRGDRRTDRVAGRTKVAAETHRPPRREAETLASRATRPRPRHRRVGAVRHLRCRSRSRKGGYEPRKVDEPHPTHTGLRELAVLPVLISSPEREVPPDNPLTTKEGWRTFVGRRAAALPQLTRAELLALRARPGTNTEQDRRRDYHADLPLVNTPEAIQKVISTGRLLVQLNRRQISARRGAIISGMSGTGKTTALTQLGRAHELAMRKRHPHDSGRLPVLYVTVPPSGHPTPGCWRWSSPASSAWSLVRAPTSPTSPTPSARSPRTPMLDLVLVDEIHNISLATRTGAEVSDQLKYFAERLPATFVYAGVEVEAQRPVRRGPRPPDRRTLHRGHRRAVFEYGTSAQRDAWHALVATLEEHPAPARPPARHPGGHGRTALPPNRRNDRQSVAAGPWRCDPGHRDRQQSR